MVYNIVQIEPTDDIWGRLGACSLFIIVGALLILTGRENIRTKMAHEHGSGRMVNSLLGYSNTYEDGTAVVVGWIRVISGVVLIVAGVTFIYQGLFPAN